MKTVEELNCLGSVFSIKPDCEKYIEQNESNQERIEQLNGIWQSKGIRNGTKNEYPNQKVQH